MTRFDADLARPLGFALALAFLLLACEGPDLGSPYDFERMLEQPRYEVYGASPFFADGMAMRVPPAHTIAYGPLPGAGPYEAAAVGRDDSADEAVSVELLEEGRERFDIFCAACHGVDGRASTPVADSMTLRPPPSLHEPRLRALPVDRIRTIAEQGYGLMPAYGGMLDPHQARAVAEYVKVLQSSQQMKLSDLPPSVRLEAREALGRTARSGSPRFLRS